MAVVATCRGFLRSWPFALTLSMLVISCEDCFIKQYCIYSPTLFFKTFYVEFHLVLMSWMRWCSATLVCFCFCLKAFVALTLCLKCPTILCVAAFNLARGSDAKETVTMEIQRWFDPNGPDFVTKATVFATVLDPQYLELKILSEINVLKFLKISNKKQEN